MKNLITNGCLAISWCRISPINSITWPKHVFCPNTKHHFILVSSIWKNKESTCPPEPIPEPFQNLASAAALCPAGFTLPWQNARHCPKRIDVVYGVSAVWENALSWPNGSFFGLRGSGACFEGRGEKSTYFDEIGAFSSALLSGGGAGHIARCDPYPASFLASLVWRDGLRRWR